MEIYWSYKSAAQAALCFWEKEKISAKQTGKIKTIIMANQEIKAVLEQRQ